uniref:Methyl-CpG-binding domain protein 4 n=1 Tax=Panagrellus redivivus TaxID=6233 RepID=A0A7E4V0P9_PANRE
MSTSTFDAVDKAMAALYSYIEHRDLKESSSLAVVDEPESRKRPAEHVEAKPLFEEPDLADDDNKVVAALWSYIEHRDREEDSSLAVNAATFESRKRPAQDVEIEWLLAPTPPKKQKRVRFLMPATEADAPASQRKRTQWLEKTKKFSALWPTQTDVFWQQMCQRDFKNVELEPEDGGIRWECHNRHILNSVDESSFY